MQKRGLAGIAHMLFQFLIMYFVATLPGVAYGNPYAFPTKLEGTWKQAGSNEGGTIQIVITKKEGASIYGIMTLTGSTYCKDPIPFQGEGGGNTARISGDAPIVCGYKGKLTGEVTKVSDEAYTGNFSYRWLGITWARGTFHLTPAKEQPVA